MLNLVQIHIFMLTCSIYNNIIGIITKGYHGCKCSGPSIKARWSKHLGNPVYILSRVFLSKDHRYRRVASTFNGKLERTQRLEKTTPTNRNREYDTEKEKKFLEMFHSNAEPLIDDLEFLETYEEKMPIGMKMKSIFYELPYWSILRLSTY